MIAPASDVTLGIWREMTSTKPQQNTTKCDHVLNHDDVIKWKHFPCYWTFVRGIHWSPVNSPHKGQWRGALMFSLICTWINGWVNNGEAGDLRCHQAHYYAIVMIFGIWKHYLEWCPHLSISGSVPNRHSYRMSAVKLHLPFFTHVICHIGIVGIHVFEYVTDNMQICSNRLPYLLSLSGKLSIRLAWKSYVCVLRKVWVLKTQSI